MSQWQICAIGSAFFAGLTVILAKVGLVNVSSNLAMLIRTIIVCIFTGLVVLVSKEWANPLLLEKKTLIFLTLSGLATGLSWLLYFRALQLGPATLVSAIDKSSLFFAVILAIIFLGERLGFAQWAGIALMAAGALLIVFK